MWDLVFDYFGERGREGGRVGCVGGGGPSPGVACSASWFLFLPGIE